MRSAKWKELDGMMTGGREGLQKELSLLEERKENPDQKRTGCKKRGKGRIPHGSRGLGKRATSSSNRLVVAEKI